MHEHSSIINDAALLSQWIEKALQNKSFSKEECCKVLDWPEERGLLLLQAAYEVRKIFHGRNVAIQLLSNAKSGGCTEDCSYCSQSAVSKADIPVYPLLDPRILVQQALSAQELKARRFCMALSGSTPDPKDLEQLCDTIRLIRKQSSLPLCCSIGFLTGSQARSLKEAGLDRVNHNLNTSRRFYPRLCSTHTYEDRTRTLYACKDAGLEICSGGIIGQGETQEDRIDLLLELHALQPQAVPINFFIPIPGTPAANHPNLLTPWDSLKFLCLARFVFGQTELRAAGGREMHLRSLQALSCFAADSIFASGYLTTSGQSLQDAQNMIRDLGFSFCME